MMFGKFFEQLRIQQEKTLRAFCQENGFDPGNISKLERGILNAPQSEKKLKEYAKALNIQEGSEEWVKFFDLAVASHRNFSVRNIKDDAALEKLPVLFRAIDREGLNEEDLDKLIKLIKES